MDNKIAILIDAENVSYKNAKQIIDTMSEKGEIIVKDIVADWAKITASRFVGKEEREGIKYHIEQVDGWRKEASKFSMTASQQFTYVSGKNTSDITIVINAMRILYEKPFINIYCLVSSDSDFTRLVQELRGNNKLVIGMGERKSIPEFVNAFSEFVYLGESLEPENNEEVDKTKTVLDKPKPKNVMPNYKKEDKSNVPEIKPLMTEDCIIGTDRLQVLKNVIEESMEETDDRVLFSVISQKMKKLYADFVPANYSCKNFGILMDKILPFMPEYFVRKEQQKNSENPTAVIKMLTRHGNKPIKKA